MTADSDILLVTYVRCYISLVQHVLYVSVATIDQNPFNFFLCIRGDGNGWQYTVIHRLMTHHVTVIHQTVFLLACNTKCVFFFEINCSRSMKILSIHICCKLMELCFNTLKTSTFSIADLPNSGILNLFECI